MKYILKFSDAWNALESIEVGNIHDQSVQDVNVLYRISRGIF